MALVDKQAPAWAEDEWEPPEPSGHLLPLEELRNKIAQSHAEHAKHGQIKVSGRTIVVCHTLPYTCNWVRPQDGPEITDTYAHNVDVKPNHEALSLHQPTLNEGASVPSEDRDLSKPLSPRSAVYGTGEDASQHQTTGSQYSSGGPQPTSPTGSASGSRWVLAPRRVHAALNSGVKSLSENNKVIMVAWPGDIRGPSGEKMGLDQLKDQQKRELEEGLADISGKDEETGVTCVPVWMPDKTASAFYKDYCKSFLWPTFHYLGLSDHQDQATEAKAWQAYYDANVAYAKKVAEVYKDGDLIWVQDYHLMLVPKLLRDMFPKAAIGEFFRCLPRREEILNGMLGANLCLFQTYSYGRHFLSSCVRVCGYEALEGGVGVDARGSITSIAYCPIGIDSDRIEAERQHENVLPKIEALRQLYKGKKIIVGRDKLDSTKGVLPKLEAYEAFLERYPEWVGNVVLIQVTTPTAHDSPQVHRKISRLVDHINGTYGNLSFAPLHHYHQMIDRDEYFALLTVADLALITSIRDGMNTTSMEYVLCQKEAKNPLILSEFTGVTGSMKEAVKVNPWDANGCARAIDMCLNMGEEEKARRHAQLYKRVTNQTAAVWAHTLVLRLLESLHQDPASEDTPRLEKNDIIERYSKANRRLLMFDYDGTLTPIVKTPSAAIPSPGLLRSLEKLAADPKNVIYIISGRDGDFLLQHLGHIQGLGFSAEHGSFLREPGEKEWKNLTEHIDMSWKVDVEEIFRHFEARTTGSFVETKRASVTFHYRNADPEYGEFQAKECQALLDAMVDKLPIDVIVGKKNLEVRPAHTHKGEIVKRLTYQHADADFLICAGDDKTDEDMFRAVFAIETNEENGSLVVTPPPSLTLFPSLAKTLDPGSIVTQQDQDDQSSALPSSTEPSKQVNGSNGVDGSTSTGKLTILPKPSKLRRESVFTIGVIPHGTRKTIAKWHLDEPSELLELLEVLAE